MSKAKQVKGPNADLVAVARGHRDQIIQFYDVHGRTGSVILLDLQKRKLHTFAFEKYRAKLRQESQPKLDEEYQRAVSKNKILVVVWDSATRRLATTRIRRP
jgi:hypothetical protein